MKKTLITLIICLIGIITNAQSYDGPKYKGLTWSKPHLHKTKKYRHFKRIKQWLYYNAKRHEDRNDNMRTRAHSRVR